MENNKKTVEHFCEVCEEKIDEAWLEGDYSVLLCSPKCCDFDRNLRDELIDNNIQIKQ